MLLFKRVMCHVSLVSTLTDWWGDRGVVHWRSLPEEGSREPDCDWSRSHWSRTGEDVHDTIEHSHPPFKTEGRTFFFLQNLTLEFVWQMSSVCVCVCRRNFSLSCQLSVIHISVLSRAPYGSDWDPKWQPSSSWAMLGAWASTWRSQRTSSASCRSRAWSSNWAQRSWERPKELTAWLMLRKFYVMVIYSHSEEGKDSIHSWCFFARARCISQRCGKDGIHSWFCC